MEQLYQVGQQLVDVVSPYLLYVFVASIALPLFSWAFRKQLAKIASFLIFIYLVAGPGFSFIYFFDLYTPFQYPTTTRGVTKRFFTESNMEFIVFVLLVLAAIAYAMHRNKPFGTHYSNNKTANQRVAQSPRRTPAAKGTVKSEQPFSDSGPVKGIALRLKRGERSGTLGSVVFTLDARIDVSAENRTLIATYKLGGRIIYESANREKYAARARQHVDNTTDQPSLLASPGAQAWGLAKTLGRVGAAAFNATASALSLRITVNSLIEGVHVECKSMEEILEAEEAIKDAALNLKAYLETSTTFSGQEQIIEL